ASHRRDLVREVDVARANVVLPQPLRRDRLQHLREIRFSNHSKADRLNRSRGAQHRRAPDGQMKIRRPAVVHELEEAIDPLNQLFTLCRNSGGTSASKSSFFIAAMYAVWLVI